MKQISDSTEEQLRRLLPVVLSAIPYTKNLKVMNAVRLLRKISKQLKELMIHNGLKKDFLRKGN